MANEAAWQAGWSEGAGLAQEQRSRKQQLTDEEFQIHANRIGDELSSNQGILATIDREKSPGAYAEKVADMQRNLQDIHQLFHPDRHPTAVAQFGHLITDRLGITNPQQRIQLVAQRRADDVADDEKHAQQLASATASMSPEQKAVQDAEAQNAGKLASVQGLLKAIPTFFPGATPEQIEKFKTDYLQKEFGIIERPTLKPFRVNGVVAYYDANHPENIPPGASAVVSGGQGRSVTKIVNVKGKGWSYVSYDPTSGVPTNILPGAPAPRSAVATQRSSTTVDPFGVESTTRSLSQPVYRGEVELEVGQPVGGNAVSVLSSAPEIDSPAGPGETSGQSSQPAPPFPAVQTPDGNKVKKPTLLELRKQAAARAPQANEGQLDVEGHIPAGAGVNEGLRQAANQLLDGADINKLAMPLKDREAASTLAAKYGYGGQGLFNPKEKLLIRESKTYLTQALSDPALKVLDSYESRVKLMNLLHASKDGSGLISKAIASKWDLSPQEQEFLRLYNQLSGTISGLAQLTRSGRITEAGINRMLAELPNPTQSHSSEDARERIKRLLSEIDVATSEGQGIDAQGSGSGAAAGFLKNFRAGGKQ